MKDSRILVVDDDPSVRLLLRELLERAGATVSEAADGQAALADLAAVAPDLIVLDVAMPGMDGWQTLERLRDMTDAPVLMLTGHDAELEKVRGLLAGADDWVVKPFGRQELLARISALMRRAARSGVEPPRESYSDDLLEIDIASARVTVRGTEVRLTPLEFRMLLAFARHRGEVLSRDRLLDLVWGDGGVAAPDQVKLYVGYVRRKLEAALGGDPAPIETIRGFGYRYGSGESGSVGPPGIGSPL